VSVKNSNNPAARASTAITTNIQTVSGTYDGSTIDVIRMGRATSAVRILVFIEVRAVRRIFNAKPLRRKDAKKKT
jgi:hypothetical protein